MEGCASREVAIQFQGGKVQGKGRDKGLEVTKVEVPKASSLVEILNFCSADEHDFHVVSDYWAFGE